MDVNQTETFRYGRSLAVAFGVIFLSRWVDWRWLQLGGESGVQDSIALIAVVGGSCAWVTSARPMQAPYTVESITVGSTLLLVLLFTQQAIWFGFRGSVGYYGGYQSDYYLNLSALAFLIVVALSFRLLEDLLRQPRELLGRVDDRTLAVSVAGVAMLLASLFVLPWYSTLIRLPSGQRIQASLKFSDWKQLYDTYGSSVSDLGLLYFEQGYLISILGAFALLYIVYRGRTKPLPVNQPIRWLIIAAIALMALWQLVIVIGMNMIDDRDGEVNFGAWFGVAGHAAILYGVFQATKRPKQPTNNIRTAVSPIAGAMPPPPSGPPVT